MYVPYSSARSVASCSVAAAQSAYGRCVSASSAATGDVVLSGSKAHLDGLMVLWGLWNLSGQAETVAGSEAEVEVEVL